MAAPSYTRLSSQLITPSSEAMATPFNPWPHLVRMANLNIKVFPGLAVTDDQLKEAAALFRDNYGVWGKQTKRAGKL